MAARNSGPKTKSVDSFVASISTEKSIAHINQMLRKDPLVIPEVERLLSSGELKEKCLLTEQFHASAWTVKDVPRYFLQDVLALLVPDILEVAVTQLLVKGGESDVCMKLVCLGCGIQKSDSLGTRYKLEWAKKMQEKHKDLGERLKNIVMVKENKALRVDWTKFGHFSLVKQGEVYTHIKHISGTKAELKVSDVARFDSGCTLEGNDAMETACIKMGSGKVKICCLDFFPDLAAEGDTPKKTAGKKGGVNLKELIGSTTKVQEQRKRSVTMLGNAITASKRAKTDE